MRGFLVVVVLAVGAAVVLWHRPGLLPSAIQRDLGQKRDISEIRARQIPELTRAFAAQGLAFGNPVYLRIFKEEAELELWVQTGETFQLFRTYPICNFSGDLGPKLAEGDRQSPEGFYRVGRSALNPNSRYHLSFNLGFPNSFDRANDRTGSYLMVHGDCLSVGCYAMTDPAIEEIYVALEAALRKGQSLVDVHAFPFRMTAHRLAQAKGTKWHGFWTQLQPAYNLFEDQRRVPGITVTAGTYRVAMN
ncbi:L,D-transpeptidase family protein [Actibacterium mucosum]|nr:murein L,D-transpeptidase family protein [Actibacterium mucosum]